MPSLIGAVNDMDPPVTAKIEDGSSTVVADIGAVRSVPPTDENMESEPGDKVVILDDVKEDDGNGEDPASSESDNGNADTSPKSQKRKVTPSGDSESKQSQQEKVKQMSLSSFFLPAKVGVSDRKSPLASENVKMSGTKRTTRSSAKNGSVLENLPSPRKRPLEDAMTKGNDVEAMKSESIQEDGTKESPPDTDNTTIEKSDAEEPINGGSAKESEDNSGNEEKTKGQTDSKVIVDLSTEEEVTEAQPHDAEEAAAAARKPKAPRKRASNKASKAEQKKAPTPPARLEEKDLDGDRRSLHQKYQTMKVRYVERSSQLVSQARSGIEEENFGKQKPEPLGENETLEDEDFPTRVVGNMALIIEGSKLPLSSLVETVCTQLKEVHGKEWSAESVSAKVKVLAQRKAYLDAATKSSGTVDLFEDADEDRVWRWEITTLDLLPSETLSNARKARTARKKVASYHAAVGKLIKSLDDAITSIFDPKLPKLDDITARISRDEEKVLKFEREAEKQRLADEAKAIKLQAKKKAKEEAAEKKKREKEEAAEKKRREKEEAAQAKEEAVEKKRREKELEEQAKKEKEQKKEKSLAKQKNCLISFFNAPKKPKAKPAKPVTATAAAPTTDFDSESFRSKINASAKMPSLHFQDLSSTAISSRKRRTRRVPVLVYTTVSHQEDEWDAPSFAEQKTIMVPNRYRFLSFHEDCRPPYHGTWSKKSSVVTGKTPFGKETSVFDYEYDSEAEWEEGDDEVGEDVDDDEKNQEEDADETLALYDYDDGFCVSDDKMLDNEENADEETRAMYKKRIQQGEVQQQMHTNRIQIIAPALGGVPLHLSTSKVTTDRYEGYVKQEVDRVLHELEGNTLYNVKLCLDAFPQLHLEEEKVSVALSTSPLNGEKDEYTKEAMTQMVRAVHHSLLNSKDKVVEELRSSHPTFFSVRAKATRKLDAIATKKKHPHITGGYYWEVKDEVLEEVGLTDLIGKLLPEIVTENESSVKEEDKKPAAEKTSAKKNSITKKSNAAPSAKKRKSPTVSEDRRKSSSLANGTGKKPKVSPKPDAAAAGMRNLMHSFLKKT